ncbi:multicopper oxidase family protein [Edaphobacter modestus]|uniref:Multicopper oxidase n=1 Tax=Edaphobacter modestus TaxID=388466 RepID=A0A4Q7Z0A6_9BACT|nr:multicopper oxidase domain-containing protein [Edaphobacter modestus]RZU43702.1 multicopper oxidase [Edaphobacter modestus]
MNRAMLESLAVTLLFAASIAAQSQVRELVQPPLLKQEPPAGVNKLAMFSLIPPKPSGCNPAASITTDGNVVSVKLDVVRTNFTMFNPATNVDDKVELRSYGGCPSGPTIEVEPGSVLRVGMHNKLNADDPSCYDNPPAGLGLPPGVGCFNTVNLHTHGLHVSPSGNSDNVLLNIAPQTDFPYEINIPTDHPAGTFWYHAHRHGSTATQVASGESGVLIVRGDREYQAGKKGEIADIDTILHDNSQKAYTEQVLSFQQIPYGCFKDDPHAPGGPWQQLLTKDGYYTAQSKSTDKVSTSPWICPANTSDTAGNKLTNGVVENFGLQLSSASIWDTNGRFTSVNGQVQPTMKIAAGEIQRWRFVHAGIHDTINLQIVKSTPHVGEKDLIAESALSGDRLDQAATVARDCAATAKTLVPQLVIASDGLTLTKIHTLTGVSKSAAQGSNYLQPGYRSDILVAFPEDGTYCLLDQAAPEGMRVKTGANGIQGGGAGPSKSQLLAYIRVEGGHAIPGGLDASVAYIEKALYDGNPQLPEPVRSGLLKGDIKPWAPLADLAQTPPAKTDDVQQANFTINGDGGGNVYFQINGKSYDPDVVNFKRQVNTIDDWTLTSVGEPHIFHIHVNPFEIMDVTTQLKDGTTVSIFDKDGNCRTDLPKDKQELDTQYCGMWHTYHDTVFVENNYQVHMRTLYDRYIGEFVIHCHILDHEDGGMMMNIEIVPDLKAPGNGLGMAGMKHGH